ncbi:MAG: hypothetical protein NVS3B6_18240 [Pseudarthrobacter sp.]
MTHTTTETSGRTDVPQARALAAETVTLVRRWLTEASKVPVDASAQQLAGVLKDPNGLDFTVGFVDGVVRPEDLHVAARNLAALAPKVPGRRWSSPLPAACSAKWWAT